MAMKRLIEYLFMESQEAAALEGLAEELGLAWESCEIKRDKAPLEKALKKIGVQGGVEECPGGFVAKMNLAAYRAACLALECPDNIHTLAELGWVAALGGDQAQTAEPAECTIKFYELDSPDEGADEAPDLEKTLKQAREFATEPMERDDEPASAPKASVGKPADGAKAKHAFHDSIEALNPAAVVEKLLGQMEEAALDPKVKAAILAKDKNHKWGKDGCCKYCSAHRTDRRPNDLCPTLFKTK